MRTSQRTEGLAASSMRCLGRSSVGPRSGATWGCVGAAQGRSVVRCRDAAVWGGAGAQQCGAAQGRSAGLRRGAAWG